jgi:hypothetical protein
MAGGASGLSFEVCEAALVVGGDGCQAFPDGDNALNEFVEAFEALFVFGFIVVVHLGEELYALGECLYAVVDVHGGGLPGRTLFSF